MRRDILSKMSRATTHYHPREQQRRGSTQRNAPTCEAAKGPRPRRQLLDAGADGFVADVRARRRATKVLVQAQCECHTQNFRCVLVLSGSHAHGTSPPPSPSGQRQEARHLVQGDRRGQQGAAPARHDARDLVRRAPKWSASLSCAPTDVVHHEDRGQFDGGAKRRAAAGAAQRAARCTARARAPRCAPRRSRAWPSRARTPQRVPRPAPPPPPPTSPLPKPARPTTSFENERRLKKCLLSHVWLTASSINSARGACRAFPLPRHPQTEKAQCHSAWLTGAETYATLRSAQRFACPSGAAPLPQSVAWAGACRPLCPGIALGHHPCLVLMNFSLCPASSSQPRQTPAAA